MALRDLFRRKRDEKRADPQISLEEWANYFAFGGNAYQLGFRQTLGEPAEEIGSDFGGVIQGAYKANGVVFACMLARMLLFSEARFQYRRLQNGRPGDLFGTQSLAPLEEPWPGATTGDLLTRAIQDVDLAGNFFGVRPRGSNEIRRLRPDWMTIVLAGEDDDDPLPKLIGYAYQPGGPSSGKDKVVYLPEEIAHFAPIPDPMANYRGMSWLTPVIREIMGDTAATTHKLKFFENGATSNMVVKLNNISNPETFDRWVEKFESGHEGLDNAYKTLYLSGGADVDVVGSNLRQIDFKVTQGAGETRIAAASGVPAVIVGLSEGLASATYSNFTQARRRFADGTIRPLWRNFAGSLERVVDVPPSAQLWYDDRDIPFVQEDRKDAAEVQAAHAGAINTLITAGFEPDSAVAAVVSGDLTRLKHSGLVSVQLNEPGKNPPGDNGSSNGAGNGVPALPQPDQGEQ
jgi:phage portal protein BeeE